MRRFNGKVFDDFVTSSTTKYTSIYWNDVLGDSDSMAICVLANHMVAFRNLKIFVEHSSDGVAWTSKGTSPTINATLTGSGEAVLYGADTSGIPSADQVRLRVSIAAGSSKVKVFVTVRDRSEASTIVSMKMALLMARIKSSVAASLVRLGNSLRHLDKPVRDELARLFKEARYKPQVCKPVQPTPSKPVKPGDHKPSVVKAVCEPLQTHRISYVYEHMSARTRSVLKSHIPEIIRAAETIFGQLLVNAAGLLGIKANLKELEALAFQGLLGERKTGATAKRPAPSSEARRGPEEHFESWGDTAGRARFSAVDDIEEVPWDDGMSSYDESEDGREIHAKHLGDNQTKSHWHANAHASPLPNAKPKKGAAHQELDQMLRKLPRDIDDQLFEMFYNWLVPQVGGSGHGSSSGKHKLKCPVD